MTGTYRLSKHVYWNEWVLTATLLNLRIYWGRTGKQTAAYSYPQDVFLQKTSFWCFHTVAILMTDVPQWPLSRKYDACLSTAVHGHRTQTLSCCWLQAVSVNNKDLLFSFNSLSSILITINIKLFHKHLFYIVIVIYCLYRANQWFYVIKSQCCSW